MNPDKFSDDDWQEILAEFRLLVSQAGFSDWDSAAGHCLTEPDKDSDGTLFSPGKQFMRPHEQLHNYVTRFISFLEVGSIEARKVRRHNLDELLRMEDDKPVEFATVDLDTRTLLIDSDQPTDEMIARLKLFLQMIDGGDDAYLDGTPELL